MSSTDQALRTGGGKLGAAGSAANQHRPLRLWPGVLLTVVLWAFIKGIDYVELAMSHRFVFRMAFFAVVLLLYLVWWLGFSRAPWKDRLLGLAVFVLGIVVAGLLADKKSMGNMGPFAILLSAFPFVLTFWSFWLVVCEKWLTRLSPNAKRVHLCISILLPIFFFDLVRWEGLDGGQHAAFNWRWVPTAEERFLADKAKTDSRPAKVNSPAATDAPAVVAGGAAKPLVLQPGDWGEFRGPKRDSQVHGVKLATDWEAHPPKLVWKHRIGPAWSSMIIVDGKLFTQEQRDQQETIACYDALTGEEKWAHNDAARFQEMLAGAGPRGTPTFSDGKLYTLGGTGVLDCLDAATGNPVWTKDITVAAESAVAPGDQLRQWGYSNSPLVADGNVIVFAGGLHEKGLLAYRADNGDLAWKTPAGSDGYSSPQLASIDGVNELLIHSNKGLFAVDPEQGKLLWQRPCDAAMFLPITQPQSVGANSLLAQNEEGVALIEVAHKDAAWEPTQKWVSKSLKPSLNDYVVYDGSVYGFDDGVFCAIDLETGKRLWKGGRYGHGQVLLLPDQPLLVVISESGEAVLISPNKTKLDELARFPMIEGKTWNHPVIAHGKLYVRNAEEMACYELPLSDGK
ncbi:MAG TPA: PQQ-binding-like beta-propeller repeat protein [Pirellulales bacterium]